MSRDRPEPVAQATWRRGAVHLWGWDGRGPAAMPWLYRGLRLDGSGRGPVWFDHTDVVRIEVDVPPERFAASSVRLDATTAITWLGGTDASGAVHAGSRTDGAAADHTIRSDSVRWFARVAAFAGRLVASGRVTAVVRDDGPAVTARWVPVFDASTSGVVDQLAVTAPTVTAVVGSDGVRAVLDGLVDGHVRTVLHHSGWRADVGRKRAPDVRAARAVFGALAGGDATIRVPDPDVRPALGALAGTLERHRRRCEGEPVVRPRVRLVPGEDPLDDWVVGIELVDDADPGRWCTAAAVRDAHPTALELAGADAHLDVLHETVHATVTAVTEALPVLAPLETDATVSLGLDEVEDFLEAAPFELARLDVELLGPEHLVRSTVGVRGRATPSPPDDRNRRFSRDALLEWSATVDGAALTDAELERVALAGSTLLHTGHRWVRIDPEGVRRARALLDQQRQRAPKLDAVALLALAAGLDDDPADPEAVPVTVEPTVPVEFVDTSEPLADDDWVSALLHGLPERHLAEAAEPEGFRGELRHYQRRGLSWLRLLADLGVGGCLADDMGLGKTATTLAHLVDRPGPHLVVCPLSVVHNWEAEARRFTPDLQVHVHHGPDRDATPLHTPERLVVVTTYGLLARDPGLAATEWTTVVFDEAQALKNPGTKVARAARALTAAQRLALTGTPVENRLDELWAIMDLVNPGSLGSRTRFRERVAMPVERHHDTEVAAALRTRIGPFVLRRTKADKRLLPELPDKIEQLAFATLTREQSVLYQQVVDQLLQEAESLSGMQRRGRVLAALTRLKQICNHPAHALADGGRLAGRSGKLARFDELVGDLLDDGQRALVFTQFREMGDLLQRHVHEHLGLDVPFLHGGVARGRRTSMVDRFQEGSGPPLLLISLKAGGTGLNLTAASQVIHYDRWWNPAVEDQATDRAWRLGQGRAVLVHKLVCQGTVEERIGEVIDEKRALADAVIGGGETWLSELATDQLHDLVRLGPEARGS